MRVGIATLIVVLLFSCTQCTPLTRVLLWIVAISLGLNLDCLTKHGIAKKIAKKNVALVFMSKNLLIVYVY